MGGPAQSFILWLTEFLSGHIWASVAVAFVAGMFVGFLIWADGMKRMGRFLRR